MKKENWFARNSRRIGITLTCLFLVLIAFIWVVFEIFVDRTTSPTTEQIDKARYMFCLDPELEIEPLGYESFKGFPDWSHSFKFIAKTDDPTAIFESTLIDPGKLLTPYDDRAMDRCWALWFDLPPRGFSGGSFNTKRDYGGHWRLDVWYGDNGDGTILVYGYTESG
ncbi:MAG: hypothetical protein AAF492_27755 [Verrucomicrobiota bacterium]